MLLGITQQKGAQPPNHGNENGKENFRPVVGPVLASS